MKVRKRKVGGICWTQNMKSGGWGEGSVGRTLGMKHEDHSSDPWCPHGQSAAVQHGSVASELDSLPVCIG